MCRGLALRRIAAPGGGRRRVGHGEDFTGRRARAPAHGDGASPSSHASAAPRSSNSATIWPLDSLSAWNMRATPYWTGVRATIARRTPREKMLVVATADIVR